MHYYSTSCNLTELLTLLAIHKTDMNEVCILEIKDEDILIATNTKELIDVFNEDEDFDASAVDDEYFYYLEVEDKIIRYTGNRDFFPYP